MQFMKSNPVFECCLYTQFGTDNIVHVTYQFHDANVSLNV